jgi:DNA-binding transcriptional ArsR family regulator
MDATSAANTLSALAHEGRLSIFRELVQAGPEGLAAGEISRRRGIAPNTLSASLTVLAHAGLVASRRDGRSIIYSAAYDRMAGLLGFLVQDCCGGRAEICAPLTRIAAAGAYCGGETQLNAGQA